MQMILSVRRAILAEQARESGKPDDIIEKMVEGRLRKYYEEVCLLEQTYVIDGDTKVGEVIEAAGKEVGAPITLSSFVRFALGEGVEKERRRFCGRSCCRGSRIKALNAMLEGGGKLSSFLFVKGSSDILVRLFLTEVTANVSPVFLDSAPALFRSLAGVGVVDGY